jgi:glycosyltransferase involved in cell wall biosynthesis
MANPPPLYTLAVYDDAPVFGGHEQMSCCGIEALAQELNLRLVCYFYQRNEKLSQKLEGIAGRHGNVKLVPMDVRSRKFQGVRSRFAGGTVSKLARWFGEDGVDAALVLQGDIELSSLGILAANKLKVPAISYIPVPHTLATMEAKLGAWRDPFNRWLFRRPDSYITISEGMKAMLRERGAEQTIEVVLNGFDGAKTEVRDRAEARGRLGLPPDRKLVAMVGRVEYKQKRQDFLLETFAENFSRMEDVHLVFVGSGPDSDDLKRRATDFGVADSATFIEWTDGLSDVYAAIDLLCLPSRFEGVPLVMLEAMSVNVPIVGSARDGMKEFLPPEWLFEPGNKAECAERILAVLAMPSPEILNQNREAAQSRFSMASFNRGFTAATRKLAGFD